MVEATVTDNSWVRNGDRTLSFDGVLHITDCSRSVELDTSFFDIEGARGNVRKLDRLIDAAQGMRDTIARVARREWPKKKL